MKSLNQLHLCKALSVFLFALSVHSEETNIDRSMQEQTMLSVLYAQSSTEYVANCIQTYSNASLILDEAMMEQFEYNDLVYNAKFNFEPIIGEVYYLYNDKNEESFLSIIQPDQCNFNYLGSFRLNSQKMWEKL